MSCQRASKFLDARGITPTEIVPASRKLGRDDAMTLAKAARRVVVAKGGKVETFEPKGKPSAAMVAAMLGPTGNLRAPTVVSGKTVLVGFNAATYAELFGA